ncbi:response regulator RpfG (plasmid) [Peptoclostridium acidaminophilum DSM 3953]|uniref:Response regulator RpfG n=2 Tax=Peptoclostridium acidaminophilum TaxID=1731 RepID=W8TQ94_PEPAC|nr:response regulator RpfG [Peptoclostridium acidaminophilum DSM 3953]
MTPYPHLFYAAIIFAAIHGGWKTTIFTIFLSSLLTSHVVLPLDVNHQIPQSLSMSFFRDFMFAFVGIGVKSSRSFIVSKYVQASKDQEQMFIQMLKIAELRDPEVTGQHLERTVAYAQILLRDMDMPNKEKELIATCIPFHDIGKISIPDSILLKPGKLTFDEFETIKHHTTIGKQILENLETSIENSHMKEFVAMAKEICHFHHEKVDGTGYPLGLKGDEIPFSAKVTALCDVYDALATERPYKAPYPHEECVRIIKEGRNTHFDSELVDNFLRVEKEFNEISEKLSQ